MKNNLMSLTVIASSLMLTACGAKIDVSRFVNPTNLAPVGVASPEDGGVVKARAIFSVNDEQQTAMMKKLNGLFMSKAYAASGSSNVTYTNSGSTTFSINTSSLGAAGFTGNTLNLGSVALANLSDNDLKVCGTNGRTKCTSAVIRVYTTGSIAGFVNAADGYGVPVFAGSLNPTSPVGLLTAGSVQVQSISIASSKNKLTIADFPTPSYSVTSDFSNAGAGSYSMVFVVEYVLFN